jgi:hypothetical protein
MQRVRVYTTDAIVLKRLNLGEADRIVTLYTPEHGKLRAIAKGARRPASRLAGHLELFSLGALQLARGRELDVFEAAAVGDSGRLADLLAGDPPAARARTADGFTALHYAAFFSRNADCARALLDAGAEPDAVADNDTDLRPINSAAGSGASEIVALLLERGADVDAAQRGGYTALHSAAHNGNEELARVLLAAGADPTRATDDGRTPADLAAEAGHAELARALAS